MGIFDAAKVTSESIANYQPIEALGELGPLWSLFPIIPDTACSGTAPDITHSGIAPYTVHRGIIPDCVCGLAKSSFQTFSDFAFPDLVDPVVFLCIILIWSNLNTSEMGIVLENVTLFSRGK